MNLCRSIGTAVRTAIVFSITLVLLPLQAFGGAFDDSAIAIRGLLMGEALSGIADDASAVFSNPAGMVGHNRETAWDIEFGTAIHSSAFTYFDGALGDKSEEVFPLPSFFLSKRITDRWAVGFGAYTPFAGGGVKYENFSQSGFELSAAAGYMAFTPVVAYKINDQWAIGLGLSVYYGVNESKSFNADTHQVVETDYSGFAGFGAYASVMYRPCGPWSIGLTFRSPVHTELDGDIKTSGTETDSELEANFPYYIDFGIGYQKDKLKLGATFVWMGYGTMDELKQTTGGVTTIIKTGYKDSYRIGLGGEYQISERLYVLAGVRFVSGAQEDAFINPLSNDVAILALSSGVRFNITKKIDLMMGYMHVLGFEKEVGAKKFDQDFDTFIIGIRQQF